jgi:hypothetical protein
MSTAISVYINFMHDIDMLNDALLLIYEHIDEVILVDGPFEWCVQTFSHFGIPIGPNAAVVEKLDPKLRGMTRYFHGIWKTEEEKRIFGYRQCSYSLIMTLDSDEFIMLNKNEITDFLLKNDKYVAGIQAINLCTFNAAFSVGNIHKTILFKKSHIDAARHLDYLWLVGCKQDRYDSSRYHYFNTSLMYHCSLLRTPESLLIKYIFYICLWHKMNNRIPNITDTAWEFTRSRIEGLGIPNSRILYDLPRRVPLLDAAISKYSDYSSFYIKVGDILPIQKSFYAVMPKKCVLTLSRLINTANIEIFSVHYNYNEAQISSIVSNTNSIELSYPKEAYLYVLHIVLTDDSHLPVTVVNVTTYGCNPSARYDVPPCSCRPHVRRQDL